MAASADGGGAVGGVLWARPSDKARVIPPIQHQANMHKSRFMGGIAKILINLDFIENKAI
jgi:hypothetical protein